MRISDWSSDVCSSDLRALWSRRKLPMARIAGVNLPTNKRVIIALTYIHGIGRKTAVDIADKLGIDHSRRVQEIGRAACRGKSVSVRVDLGGRRIIKNKKKKNT